jgi:hypothetical protein
LAQKLVYVLEKGKSKTMRGLAITSVFTLITAIGCVSQQQLVQTPPFEIRSPSFRMIISGQEASLNQIELRMDWDVNNGYIIIPDTIYFRGGEAMSFVEDSIEGNILAARFTVDKPTKGDLIMHANPLKEVGNQPSLPLSRNKELSYELDNSEAILAYRIAGKQGRFYYKIMGIVEKQTIIMPSKPH